MQVYRKNIIIQLILFVVFFLMGVNVILTYFYGATAPWISFVFLGILVAFAVTGFILYRRPDTRICIITQKEIQTIRYLLYGYFFVYIVQIFLSGSTSINPMIASIVVGVILMSIAVYGLWLQLRILKTK